MGVPTYIFVLGFRPQYAIPLSNATVSYLLFESLNWQYGLMVFALGFTNTLIGQKVLNAIVKKYNRSSIIILLIATIVGMSSIAMGLESSGTLIDYFQGKEVAARTLC